MNTQMLRSLMVALVLSIPLQVHAQVGDSTGNIVGNVENLGSGSYSVTATSPSTGRTRTATIGADGNFRFSQLPTGAYELSITRDGKVVARDNFSVGLDGNTAARFRLADPNTLAEVVVNSSRVTGDVYSTDSGLVLSTEEIHLLPVEHNMVGVSMLAPGTVLGDAKFGLSGGQGLVSFGGSSVAENSCYINGLEVTNTRQGLGCGEVPFEFYQEFQVKTGGYSAQYGRTTGGVLNAVTKSGTNEWEFTAGLGFEPKSLYEKGNISRGSGGLGSGTGGTGTGGVFRNTTKDEAGLTEAWVTAAGPIIKDRLFLFAIVNPRDKSSNFAGQTNGTDEFAIDNEYRRLESSGKDNLFWGAKVDWDINDDHRLSAWGYSNRSDATDVHYGFNGETGVIGTTATQTRIRKRGGEAKSVTYRGHFFDNFTVSAMWGKLETQYQSDPDNTVDCPTVNDQRPGLPGGRILGCGPGGQFGSNNDSNDQIRLDLEWALGSHVLRAGYDKQTRDSQNISVPIGGHSWTYRTLANLGTLQTTNGPFTNTTGAPLQYVRDRIFSNENFGGAFSSDLKAYYLEDEWQLNDNITVYAGLRKDQLTNKGAGDVVFASFDQSWAPRVGFSWDPTGAGSNKFYGTFGRYYLPIANNTNFRVGGGISDISSFYRYTGVNSADGQPTGTTLLPCASGSCVSVNSVGRPPTKDEFQAKEANPFYKDEIIFGYERTLGDEYSMELIGVYRNTGATLDDYCGPVANPGYCTLVNPGSGGSWSAGPGDPLVFHSAAEIGLPKAVNKYKSVQLKLNRATDKLRYSFVYALGKSYGNFEGAVKSDITQADAGITQDFDFPALMDGAYGDLPNDRRHSFKFYGTYNLTENLTAGWNSTLTSGRPLSAFGAGYTSDDPAIFGSYGDTYYLFTNTCTTAGAVGPCTATNVQADKIYTYTGRGNNGRTPWLFSLDASMGYAFQTGNVDWSANLNIYNVLNIQEGVMTNEHAENGEGIANEFFGSTYYWQQPRHVRLSIQAKF
jgi:hypothetical protein